MNTAFLHKKIICYSLTDALLSVFSSALASVLLFEQQDAFAEALLQFSPLADFSLQQAVLFPLQHDFEVDFSSAATLLLSAAGATSSDATLVAAAGAVAFTELLCAFTLVAANTHSAAASTNSFFILIFI